MTDQAKVLVRKGGLEPPRVLPHQILNLDNKWSKTIQSYEKQTDDTDSRHPINPFLSVSIRL